MHDLRVADIARHAQTSSATFYVYFNGVSDAVLALVESVTQSPPNLLAVVASPWPPDEAPARARAFLTGYLELWEAHGALFRARNLASDEGDARITAARIHAVEPLVARLAAQIRTQQTAGRAPRAINPMAAAGALLALIERVAAQATSHPEAGAKSELLHVAGFFLVLLLCPDAALARGRPRQTRSNAVGRRSLEDLAAFEDASLRALAEGQANAKALGQKGNQTRARLLAATERELANTPLRALTVSRIAGAAGTSPAAFYFYFRDVTEAVLALAVAHTLCDDDTLRLLSATLQRRSLSAARAFVRHYIARWRADGALLRLRNLIADQGDGRFYAARARAVRPLLDRIASKIETQQALGAAPGGLDPIVAAAAFVAMLERIAATPSIQPWSYISRESVGDAAAYFLIVLIGGKTARGPQ